MAIQDFTAGQVLTAAQMDSLQANDYNWTVSTKTDSYVLVAADKGTRVVMNAATAKTITVNSGLFAAGDTLFIQNIGAGTCTITAGTCTVTTASSLALAQWGGGTLYFTSASAAIFFSGGGATYGTGTGGTGVTSTTVGGVSYEYTSFTSTGTFTVTKSGLFDILAFGGGSGGGTYSNGSSGGGSGGIVLDTIYLTANISIVIGAGGTGNAYNSFARYGSATTFGTLPSGRVAAGSYSTCNAGTGASEGLLGGLVGSVAGTASTGVTNAQGYAGGNSTATTNGGGGGSTTAVGGNGATTAGGHGAAGYDVSTFIGGSALYKGAGGGGAGSVTQGTGGSGVGTAGTTGTSTAAAANTASGAGGGNTASGNGGSGILYIRWKV